MSEEEMEILKKLSKETYFGDMLFVYYADIIGKLIANYNNEKEKREELEEYKKISELTKISCCTAQNCGALSNAIRNGLENQKLREELEQEKEKNQELKRLDKSNSQIIANMSTRHFHDRKKIRNSISKDKIRETQNKIHKILDENGITRAYQLVVDKEFEELLEEE